MTDDSTIVGSGRGKASGFGTYMCAGSGVGSSTGESTEIDLNGAGCGSVYARIIDLTVEGEGTGKGSSDGARGGMKGSGKGAAAGEGNVHGFGSG
jgi:hypothetical protein